MVGVLAIFDGHGGEEASEMSSKKLLDYFLLHVVFSTYKQSLPSKNKHYLVSQGKNDTENNMLTLGRYNVVTKEKKNSEIITFQI